MNNKIIGYTCGAFDMFHVGHLNILRNAKSMCDHLIVAVSTNGLIESTKNTKPVISFEHRIEIVRNIQYVDMAISQNNLDKITAHRKLKYDILFVGDDWYDSPKWAEYENTLNGHGAKIVYFPYTEKISTTKIKNEASRKEADI